MSPGPRPTSVHERIVRMAVRRDTGCLEWVGYVGQFGYGKIKVGSRIDGTQRTVNAHRAMFEHHIGGPIPAGLLVRHKCDNRLCVEIEHLELGTPRDNAQDMSVRGRSTRGTRSVNAKLTDELVREARRLVACGVPQRAVARQMGVHRKTLFLAVHRKTWGHVA